MRFNRLFTILLTLTIVLASCGSKIEQGSLEGRVAALAENHENVFVIMSVDLDKIITKSGVFDGAVPEQFVATAKPFKEALYASINLEKPLYALVEGPMKRDAPEHVIVLFEVKDATKLKAEFKDMNVQFTGDDKFSTANRDEMGIALIENKIGMMIINVSGAEVSAQQLKQYADNSGKVSKDKLLAEKIMERADMTFVTMLDRVYGVIPENEAMSLEAMATMKENAKGSYFLAKMNFNEGQAEMNVDYTFGEGMQKYLPAFSGAPSNAALSALGSGSPIFAMAMNMDFKKMVNNIYENIPAKDRAEIDQALAMVGGKDKVADMFTGEFALAAYSQSEQFDPLFNAFLGLNDASYLKTLVTGFGPMAGMRTAEDGTYIFGDDARMKLDDKSMVFSSDVEGFDELINGKKGQLIVPKGVEFGKTGFSMFVDFSKLDPKDFPRDARMFVEALSYMSVNGDDNGMKAILKAKSSDKNILRQLVEMGMESMNTTFNDEEFEEWDDEEWDEFDDDDFMF